MWIKYRDLHWPPGRKVAWLHREKGTECAPQQVPVMWTGPGCAEVLHPHPNTEPGPTMMAWASLVAHGHVLSPWACSALEVRDGGHLETFVSQQDKDWGVNTGKRMEIAFGVVLTALRYLPMCDRYLLEARFTGDPHFACPAPTPCRSWRSTDQGARGLMLANVYLQALK